ncbi:hypothetical protein AciX8_4778 [Granulicella mallensis MP5ACTX8]|uniref:Uncharacterized protein n=1 Tax=Granulicella mallensis (strain ATCC BAA-1857 / DSM 23137 / MP5ACTX8) TaxID=682795 RepID=G8NYI8_GRAMM|nr:hypothetical protein AciX8_4778 [Granulicella mallensis MP5ACTX8]
MKLAHRLFLGGAGAMNTTTLLRANAETFSYDASASFSLVANSTLTLRRVPGIGPLPASLTQKA